MQAAVVMFFLVFVSVVAAAFGYIAGKHDGRLEAGSIYGKIQAMEAANTIERINKLEVENANLRSRIESAIANLTE